MLNSSRSCVTRLVKRNMIIDSVVLERKCQKLVVRLIPCCNFFNTLVRSRPWKNVNNSRVSRRLMHASDSLEDKFTSNIYTGSEFDETLPLQEIEPEISETSISDRHIPEKSRKHSIFDSLSGFNVPRLEIWDNIDIDDLLSNVSQNIGNRNPVPITDSLINFFFKLRSLGPNVYATNEMYEVVCRVLDVHGKNPIICETGFKIFDTFADIKDNSMDDNKIKACKQIIDYIRVHADHRGICQHGLYAISRSCRDAPHICHAIAEHNGCTVVAGLLKRFTDGKLFRVISASIRCMCDDPRNIEKFRKQHVTKELIDTMKSLSARGLAYSPSINALKLFSSGLEGQTELFNLGAVDLMLSYFKLYHFQENVLLSTLAAFSLFVEGNEIVKNDVYEKKGHKMFCDLIYRYMDDDLIICNVLYGVSVLSEGHYDIQNSLFMEGICMSLSEIVNLYKHAHYTMGEVLHLVQCMTERDATRSGDCYSILKAELLKLNVLDVIITIMKDHSTYGNIAERGARAIANIIDDDDDGDVYLTKFDKLGICDVIGRSFVNNSRQESVGLALLKTIGQLMARSESMCNQLMSHEALDLIMSHARSYSVMPDECMLTIELFVKASSEYSRQFVRYDGIELLRRGVCNEKEPCMSSLRIIMHLMEFEEFEAVLGRETLREALMSRLNNSNDDDECGTIIRDIVLWIDRTK